MRKFEIDEKTANAIIQYLWKQPYGDVFQMINSLSKLQELSEDPKNKGDDKSNK